jgi:hypothetical protein
VTEHVVDVACTWISTVLLVGSSVGRLAGFVVICFLLHALPFLVLLYDTLFALPPHHVFQAHFITISNIAKAWEGVNGVMYECHLE